MQSASNYSRELILITVDDTSAQSRYLFDSVNEDAFEAAAVAESAHVRSWMQQARLPLASRPP